MSLSSDKLFTPGNKTTYIGVNRFYSTAEIKGSGVCKFLCHVTSNNTSDDSIPLLNSEEQNGRITLTGSDERYEEHDGRLSKMSARLGIRRSGKK